MCCFGWSQAWESLLGQGACTWSFLVKYTKGFKAQFLQEWPLCEFCLFQILIPWALAFLHSLPKAVTCLGSILALARCIGKKLRGPYNRLLVPFDLGWSPKSFLDILTVQLSAHVLWMEHFTNSYWRLKFNIIKALLCLSCQLGYLLLCRGFIVLVNSSQSLVLDTSVKLFATLRHNYIISSSSSSSCCYCAKYVLFTEKLRN